MLPHPDRRHRHFPDMVMHFPRVLLPQANCFFSEVLYTTLHAMIYMSFQREIYLQLSCKPAERFPAHVSGMQARSLAASF